MYDLHGNYLLPGFIDGHLHLESSLLSPARYAEAVVPHGTTTVVADPHEIANVTRIAGLRYMLQATERLPLEVYFMVPSCVPVTALETAGAELRPSLVAATLHQNRILGLAAVADVEEVPAEFLHTVHLPPLSRETLTMPATSSKVRVVEIVPGQILTRQQIREAPVPSPPCSQGQRAAAIPPPSAQRRRPEWLVTIEDTLLETRCKRMQSSAIRELLKLTERPEMISFAGGLPAPEVFPVDQFQAASQRILAEHGPQALQYSPTEGYRPLREMIARHTVRYGIAVEPENILITSGSQQALDLIGKIFINPGDRLLVERPTYVGALQAWNAYQAEYITIALDDEGLQTDDLEATLRAGPKFIYVLPNFHNPAGVTLALERRQRLVELAERYGVPLIEDDPYGQLRYDGEHLPPLAVLDRQLQGREGAPYSGNVLYLSTFSKTLAPGLRLGWVVAPAEVIQRLVHAKQGADLHTSTLAQMIAFEVARAGFLDRHVRFIRTVYRERRDAMVAALQKYFPGEVNWTTPQRGLFLWVTLPEPMDAAEILQAAIAENVAFVPSAAFFADGTGRNTFRLNFSNASPTKDQGGHPASGSRAGAYTRGYC